MPPVGHTLQGDPVGALLEEWEAAFAALGERPFRARQVFRWIHTRSVAAPEEMSDLARSLREKLAGFGLAMPARVEAVHRAGDGTRKVLVAFPRSAAAGTVETVLIPPMPEEDVDGDDGEDDAPAAEPVPAVARVTQCISTQVGCAMGCVFCASGVAGLKGHLTAGEIVAQVLLGRRLLAPGEALRNVVLMGMGEPLHNYDAVARALRLLTHPEGLNLSTRRVTVSTSGLVPELERLGRDFRGEVALAVSLHAPDDATRSALMPVNRRHPLGELLPALRRYPLARRRRITIEYTLIDGVNASVAQARALVKVLRGIPAKVNLIPVNAVAGEAFLPPSREAVLAFQAQLRSEGLSVFIRRTRGDDIAAACGQLALQGARPVRRALPVLPRGGLP
jgi:23S rRNA (adenine2503-C2)-methyltransferase